MELLGGDPYLSFSRYAEKQIRSGSQNPEAVWRQIGAEPPVKDETSLDLQLARIPPPSPTLWSLLVHPWVNPTVDDNPYRDSLVGLENLCDCGTPACLTPYEDQLLEEGSVHLSCLLHRTGAYLLLTRCLLTAGLPQRQGDTERAWKTSLRKAVGVHNPSLPLSSLISSCTSRGPG